ncbi:MAG: hypothetical protein F6K23_01240 [Okeania sp. SIO2C9]|uniref:hypothetical protein n=1 Tax=Okeania sp. SIO2C9 TaxID=2607791 RepID=UPI0013C13C86|nr:hypothetical protein [Okeania sp. SIO2C9]NEQ71825.1 hypothetical protein [Okeania sp. SIO2C9]
MPFAPSFLDGDDLPNYGEKPNDWKPKSFRQASLTGKRIKRCSAAKGGFPHERLHQEAWFV